jgi:hypothetical protein
MTDISQAWLPEEKRPLPLIERFALAAFAASTQDLLCGIFGGMAMIAALFGGFSGGRLRTETFAMRGAPVMMMVCAFGCVFLSYIFLFNNSFCARRARSDGRPLLLFVRMNCTTLICTYVYHTAIHTILGVRYTAM